MSDPYSIRSISRIEPQKASDAIWGLVCGYPSGIRNGRLLGMWRGFFDESATGRFFVMAGFVATAPQWARFSDEWQALLEEPPRLRFFKMREAAALEGEFASHNKEMRDARVARFQRLTSKHHLSYGIGCIIPVADYKAEVRGRLAKPLDSPQYFAITWAMHTAVKYLYDNGMSGKIDFLFDKQDVTTWAEALVAWGKWKSGQDDEIPASYRRRLGGLPNMQDDIDILPLQAADMLAWCLRMQHERELLGDEVKRERFGIEIEIPVFSVVWDKPALATMVKRSLAKRGKLGLGGYETGPMRSRRIGALRKLIQR